MADGISGITKRAAARESLKPNVRILKAKDLYEYCQGFLGSTTLQYLLISKEQIDEMNLKHNLTSKYEVSKTIHGTRKNHSFVPNGNTMDIRRYSLSPEKIEYTFENLPKFQDLSKYEEGDYIIFLLSSLKFIGLIRSLDFDEGEITLWQMNQRKKDNIFSWPTIEKEKIISINSIINKIDIPNLIVTTRLNTTRNITYSLSANDFELLSSPNTE
jgi:hypothetical protein